MLNNRSRGIFVIGAQCTGKTTLVKALQEHFAERKAGATPGPAIISEVARDALGRTGITRKDIASSPERCLALQKAILAAQFDAESLLHDRNAFYISDRSGLDPVAYTKLFVGSAAMDEMLQSQHWRVLEQHMINGLVFLCEAGCKWLVDDGVRLMPEDGADWERVDSAFRSLLKERGISYTLISKDLTVAERVSLVLEKCET